MFDIGFPELLIIAIVGLLVIGPERLPEALRTLGLWIGRLRRSFNNVKTEIEKEIGMDDIRRQLHNEAVMEEMRRIERDVRDSVNSGAADEGVAGHERAARSDKQPAGREPAETPGSGEAAAGASHGADSSERSADASAQPPGPSPAPGTTPRGAPHADEAHAGDTNDASDTNDDPHNNKHDHNRQHG